MPVLSVPPTPQPIGQCLQPCRFTNQLACLARIATHLQLRALVLFPGIGSLEASGTSAYGVHPYWAGVYEVMLVAEQSEDMSRG
jgi:hypothetical protein